MGWVQLAILVTFAVLYAFSPKTFMKDVPFAPVPWLAAGERVVDVGSGGGFDSFVAAGQVGPTGRVVGVDMTAEMLAKSRASAVAMGLGQVEFRAGLAERLPVEDGWADVVISNGVINLCADKRLVLAEIRRKVANRHLT